MADNRVKLHVYRLLDLTKVTLHDKWQSDCMKVIVYKDCVRQFCPDPKDKKHVEYYDALDYQGFFVDKDTKYISHGDYENDLNWKKSYDA